MRHITVLAYDQPPCGGLIEQVAVDRPPPPTQTASGALRGGDGFVRLPLATAVMPGPGGEAPGPAYEWRCTRCGHVWQREPLFDEAL